MEIGDLGYFLSASHWIGLDWVAGAAGRLAWPGLTVPLDLLNQWFFFCLFFTWYWFHAAIFFAMVLVPCRTLLVGFLPSYLRDGLNSLGLSLPLCICCLGQQSPLTIFCVVGIHVNFFHGVNPCGYSGTLVLGHLALFNFCHGVNPWGTLVLLLVIFTMVLIHACLLAPLCFSKWFS